MPQEKIYELESDDYSQSANTLFHFMKESRFLNDILIKKAIIPRYCNKDLSLSLNFSFDNEATRQSFISAIKKATEEGITIRPEGTVTVNSAIRNEKSIFYTSGSNKLTQIRYILSASTI